MISPVAGFPIRVPGRARRSICLPLMVVHTARCDSTLSGALEANSQRGAVAQGLLGRRICTSDVVEVAKEGVGGGDDVLNLGACLRFKERNRVDEYRGIGH